MFKKSLLASVLAFSSLFAMSGLLRDNSGNPLADASVRLLKLGKETTTTATGAFVFDGDLPIGQPRGRSDRFLSEPVLSGSSLYFYMQQEGGFELALHNLKGGLVKKVSSRAGQGNQVLALDAYTSLVPEGVYILTFKSSGGQQGMYRYLHSKNPRLGVVPAAQATSANATVAKILATPIDTLLIKKIIGDVTSTRKVLIYSYQDNINSPIYTADSTQILIIDPSNDNDGDGLTNYEERYVYFTNAEIADTDGDGYSDQYEILNTMDPLQANIPQIAFRMKTTPQMKAIFSKTIGESKEKSISKGGDQTNSSSFTNGGEHNWSAELAATLGFENSWGVDGGFTLNGSLTFTGGYGGSTSWSSEQSRSMSVNWSEAVALAQSNETSISGGEIVIDIELENTSSQVVKLVNPKVRLRPNSFQSSMLESLIGELTLADENDKTVTIQPAPASNKVTVQFKAIINNPDLFEAICKLSNGLTAQLTNIQFETSLGATDTLMGNVYRRTAQVIVDPGFYSPTGKNLVKKYVTTKNRYNEFYTTYRDRYIPVSLHDLLVSMGVTVVYGETNGKNGIKSVDGLANGDVANGSWAVVVQTATDSILVYGVGAAYNPKTISAKSASLFTLIYSADTDNDGLPDRMEAALGTELKVADTDGDSISDGDEVFGWVRATDPVGTLWKTNPLRKDTDVDSLGDFTDPDPLTALDNPLDGAITLSKITLTPKQGSGWTRVITDVDTGATLNLPVKQILRGPIKISLLFGYPVRSIVVTRKGSADTSMIKDPDVGTKATYTATFNQVLGLNHLIITAISKNGKTTRTFNLDSIDRRLAQIDAKNQNIFKTSLPASTTDYGIKITSITNFDSIKTLDPLITNVVLLALPVTYSSTSYTYIIDSAWSRAPELGDVAGSGALLDSGDNILMNIHGAPTNYTVSDIISGTTFMPRKIAATHSNDYIYFPYSANINGANCTYATPLDRVGAFQANNRDVLIDSVVLIMAIRKNWNLIGEYPWQHVAQSHVNVGNTFAKGRTTATTWAGGYITTKIDLGGADVTGDYQLDFSNYLFEGVSEANFRALDQFTWLNIAYLPPIKLGNIVAPTLDNNIDKNESGGGITPWIYREFSVGSYKRTHWYTEYNWNGSVTFASGFEIFWRYKYNAPTN